MATATTTTTAITTTMGTIAKTKQKQHKRFPQSTHAVSLQLHRAVAGPAAAAEVVVAATHATLRPLEV